MKQVLVIVGPTAVGKSDFGVKIAQEINGEIISGDSIQVYKGFDIGSGKVTSDETKGIPHHLIDMLEPKDSYSVADFQMHARSAIQTINEKGKLPIVVGGTGLYIKACMYDYQFSEAIDRKTDPDLETMDNESLYELLKKLDFESCRNIHPNNRKRVIRAIMIARSGKTKSETEASQEHRPIYDVLFLGLTCSRERLYERINLRVDKMAENGLEEEIRALLEQGVEFSNQAMQGIGYREWEPYFKQESSKEEVVENIKTHSRQFAKRQYTWFNNQMPVHWIDIEEENWQQKALITIKEWRKVNE